MKRKNKKIIALVLAAALFLTGMPGGGGETGIGGGNVMEGFWGGGSAGR